MKNDQAITMNSTEIVFSQNRPLSFRLISDFRHQIRDEADVVLPRCFPAFCPKQGQPRRRRHHHVVLAFLRDHAFCFRPRHHNDRTLLRLLHAEEPAFAGTGFWDGTETGDFPIQKYIQLYETGRLVSGHKRDTNTTNLDAYYTIRYDTYIRGYSYKSFEEAEFNELVAYDKTVDEKHRILCPMVDYDTYAATAFKSNPALRNLTKSYYLQNAYVTYKIDKKQQPIYVLDANGDAIIDPETGRVELESILKKDSEGNYVYYNRTGDAGAYSYSCRVNFDNYYAKTHNGAPLYILGSETIRVATL
jgi:hypothetical protein